jgi:transposase-like protein
MKQRKASSGVDNRSLARSSRRSRQARPAAARVPHHRWRSGVEKALAAVWGDVPTQRCTVHKHRNLLAHAPERLHDEITADYTDMIYAANPQDIEELRRTFIHKWRIRHRAVGDSLEEAADCLFTFTRLPPSQWRRARTANAIERFHEEFKRRIKTQTLLSSADTSSDAVLGAARQRADQHAQGRRMANARHKTNRSAD